ncbi:MAG: Unknown protein [uncultured Sulfurovum sp.]|uniref:Uncharacterized protein n=1 Tax=uncultured Sulfurovum sp. TaxID=269237 RepID=A0A6S6SEZ8_9BACT|nr:MAG: Unknown protein [uncultured Sulfurovum sp.]
MKKLSLITILALGLTSSAQAEESMTAILGAVDSETVKAIEATEGTRDYSGVEVTNNATTYQAQNINSINGVKFASKNTKATNLNVENSSSNNAVFNLNTANGIKF